MKKLLLVGIAATAMLASCSNDETVGTPEQNAAIGFSSFVDKSTRAVNTGNKLEDPFKVWGFRGDVNDFVNVEQVAVDGTYNPAQYWTLGYKYNFAAIAPQSVVGKDTEVTCTNGTVSGTLNFTNEDNVTDLLYAFNGDMDATDEIPTGKVQLTFDHMLSKVKFTFANGFDTDEYSFYVENVTIKNVESQAALTIPAKEWSSFTEQKDVPFGNVASNGDDIIKQNADDETEPKLIIPNVDKVIYTVTFDLYVYKNEVNLKADGSAYKHSVEMPEMLFVMGNGYNFKATIGNTNYDPNLDPDKETKIEFEPSVKTWIEIDDETGDEYGGELDGYEVSTEGE